MRAVWYDRRGPAHEVLQIGELPDPEPATGEVRVRVSLSGVNPGDTKKRAGWLNSPMPFPRVIPHSDGSGVVESVGPGVDARRIGQRVWIYGAQSYRPFGTAAELVVVPSELAVDIPDGVTDELAACLGIPGITAHRAVFADGPVEGKTVLVNGALGGVGLLATQLAHWGGATVIAAVRRVGDLDALDVFGAGSALSVFGAGSALDGLGTGSRFHAVSLDQVDSAAVIRRHAPEGVDRIVEVAFSDNVDLDASVIRNGGVIAAYATRADHPSFPFWPMLFDNVTIRLLGSDDFPVAAKRAAAADLTAAARDGALMPRIDPPMPLQQVAQAHDRVDTGTRARILLRVTD